MTPQISNGTQRRCTGVTLRSARNLGSFISVSLCPAQSIPHRICDYCTARCERHERVPDLEMTIHYPSGNNRMRGTMHPFAFCADKFGFVPASACLAGISVLKSITDSERIASISPFELALLLASFADQTPEPSCGHTPVVLEELERCLGRGSKI